MAIRWVNCNVATLHLTPMSGLTGCRKQRQSIRFRLTTWPQLSLSFHTLDIVSQVENITSSCGLHEIPSFRYVYHHCFSDYPVPYFTAPRLSECQARQGLSRESAQEGPTCVRNWFFFFLVVAARSVPCLARGETNHSSSIQQRSEREGPT